jgi:hypothetical protein
MCPIGTTTRTPEQPRGRGEDPPSYACRGFWTGTAPRARGGHLLNSDNTAGWGVSPSNGGGLRPVKRTVEAGLFACSSPAGGMSTGTALDAPDQRVLSLVRAARHGTAEPVIGSLCTGAGGLDLGCSPRSVVGASRGAPTPTRTCGPSWPRACPGCPTSATSAPSTGPPSSRSTCSPPVSPAKTSPPPATARASRRERAVDCGPTSWPPFAYYDPPSSSWKTSPRSAGKAADSTVFSATWPTRGMTRHGAASSPPTSAPRTAVSGCSCSDGRARARELPTPQARDGDGHGPSDPAARIAAGRQVNLSDVISAVVALLPTPTAINPNDSEDPAHWLARRARHQARRINGNGMGMPLSIAVRLLPTPTASDAKNCTHRTQGGGPSLPDQVRLLPTQTAHDGSSNGISATSRLGGPSLPDQVRLLPTPTATDGTKGCPRQRGSKGDLMLPSAVVHLEHPTQPSRAPGWTGRSTSRPSAAGNDRSAA